MSKVNQVSKERKGIYDSFKISKKEITMTHDELLAKIDDSTDGLKHEDIFPLLIANTNALGAAVKLHRPNHSIRGYRCRFDDETFPCTTIQVIEKALN